MRVCDLGWTSIVVINTICLASTSMSLCITEGSQSRSRRQEPGGRSHGGALLAGLLLMACSMEGITHHRLGAPTSILHQENASQAFPQANQEDIIFTIEFNSSQMIPAFFKLTKPTNTSSVQFGIWIQLAL